MKTISFPGKCSIGLLLDPDKAGGDSLKKLLRSAEKSNVDFLIAGGSITFRNIDLLIDEIRAGSELPVILFPGNLMQLSIKADLIMLLSLISGRNPELLIGNHVTAAPFLRNVKEKLIPTGYILISSGTRTSVEYISQTESIPSNKPDIAVATALAGEMLGLKTIYLEAGSGADQPVPPDLIKAVRENVSLPIIVGGGLRSGKDIASAYEAGANLTILGNGCEKNPSLLAEACSIRDDFRKTT